MIALAVAALLTTGALAIWAARVVRRPIDWSGPFTVGPPPPPTFADVMRTIGQIAAQISNVGDVITDAFVAGAQAYADGRRKENQFLPGGPIPMGGSGIAPPGTYRPLTLDMLRALRASERDDRRREGQ